MDVVMPYLLMALVSILLSGCGSEDDAASSTPVAAQVAGLWVGTTTETVSATETELDTHILFSGPTVFILREDEGHIGTYEVESNGHVTMDTEVFAYATPDTDNNFYIGTRNSSRITLDSLFATELTMFANYDGGTRSGSIELDLDTGQISDLTLDRVRGSWSTTDSVLYINDEGGLIGSAAGCQWEGDLFSLSEGFLRLSLERKLCAEFNQTSGSPIEGIAFIDGEGSLHFLAQDNNVFLWQRFDASTGTTTTTTEEEEEEE